MLLGVTVYAFRFLDILRDGLAVLDEGFPESFRKLAPFSREYTVRMLTNGR
jgi:hypothetical protein